MEVGGIGSPILRRFSMEEDMPEDFDLSDELLPEVRQERWDNVWSKATFDDIIWDASDTTAKIYNGETTVLIVDAPDTTTWIDIKD